MKKIIFTLLITLVSLTGYTQKDAYKIKMNIKGMQDSACYLISYYGNKLQYRDTSKFDKNGTVIFSGKKELGSGIYAVYTSNKSLFEFILNEPIIEIDTDTADYIKNMVVKKSEENRVFFEHLLFTSEKQKRAQELRKRYNNEEVKDEEKEKIAKEIRGIDKEIKKYQSIVIEKHPTLFTSTIFKAMADPVTPGFKEEKNDSINKLLRYQYYKNHFFDNINFSNGNINRTPIYHNKLEKYFKSVVHPHPDSIINSVDFILNRTKANDELFKYTTYHLINKYERSKIMGMDAVFTHIALNYFTHELAYWADSSQVEKVQEKAEKLAPLLIGKQAPNLSLLDTSGQNWVDMYQIKANYTILIFWDPDCGHCKKELPKIVEYCHTIKDKGIVVYAVSSDHNESWKKFIRENKLDFINVAVPRIVYEEQDKATEYILKGYTDLESLNYHSTYDVFSTPQIYLLDENKKIIGKKLDADILKKLLDNRI